jgi:hypothetical protein
MEFAADADVRGLVVGFPLGHGIFRTCPSHLSPSQAAGVGHSPSFLGNDEPQAGRGNKNAHSVSLLPAWMSVTTMCLPFESLFFTAVAAARLPCDLARRPCIQQPHPLPVVTRPTKPTRAGSFAPESGIDSDARNACIHETASGA